MLGIILGMIVSGFLTPQQAASGGAVISPFPLDTAERVALAESFDNAAGQLENGTERLLVDEYIRTAIARQPTSGQWANEIDKIVQTAHSPNPMIYAKNLRLIAKGLR